MTRIFQKIKNVVLCFTENNETQYLVNFSCQKIHWSNGDDLKSKHLLDISLPNQVIKLQSEL